MTSGFAVVGPEAGLRLPARSVRGATANPSLFRLGVRPGRSNTLCPRICRWHRFAGQRIRPITGIVARRPEFVRLGGSKLRRSRQHPVKLLAMTSAMGYV